VSNALELV